MSHYRDLLWDVDGTILDFDAAERAAIRSLFERFKLGACTDAMLTHYHNINKKYWQMLERGEMTKDRILIERFREFFSTEGLDPDVATAFNSEYQYALGDTIVIRDDAIEIIKALKKTCRIIIVTNGTAIAQKKKLERSGIVDVADYIFISELVGFEKPSVRFFEKVFAQAGVDEPNRALIIGDSLTSDMQGGYNAGIDACWYNPYGMKNDSALTPAYEIHDLHEIIAIV